MIENGSDTILAEGLGYDRCQVGIITNIDPVRHYGKFYIETPEQVCNVLRTQVDVVLDDGVAVLNADDPLVAQMAEFCDGEVMYFSRHAASELIATHLQRGGRAVLVRNGSIMLQLPANERIGIDAVVACALAGEQHATPYRMDSVLAAVAAAWALNITPGLIRAGLATFEVEHRKIQRISFNGCLTHSRAARPEPVESAYLHRSHRAPAARRSRISPKIRPVRDSALRTLFPEIALLQTGRAQAAVYRWRMCWNWPHWACRRRPDVLVTFSRTTATLEAGVYQVVVEYSEESVGRRAFDLAEQLCNAALHNTGFDLAAALSELRELDEDERLGPSTGVYRRCRRGARHPLPPPDPRQPGAIRLG